MQKGYFLLQRKKGTTSEKELEEGKKEVKEITGK